MGERDYQLSAVCTNLDKFDIILGQPWLEVVNPDIDWTTKTVRDRKYGIILATVDMLYPYVYNYWKPRRWHEKYGRNQSTYSW